jgi:hypothetical protein
MTITDYKLIQADGNRELAEEVKRFIDMGEGWEPFEAPISSLVVGDETAKVYHYFAQAIVKRTTESETMLRLRHWHREATEAVTAWEQGQVDAESALGHIRAVLANHLVKGGG